MEITLVVGWVGSLLELGSAGLPWCSSGLRKGLEFEGRTCHLNEVTRWISLKDWVGGLVAELKAADPSGQGWTQGKLTTEVRVFRLPDQEGWFVSATHDSHSTEAGGQLIRVELGWGDGVVTPAGANSGAGIGAGASMPAEGGASQQSLPDHERRQRLVSQLAQVLGTPGFDSSSRATVFRECTEGRTDPELRLILDRLQADGIPIADERLRSTQHRLNGILRTGPMKSRSRGAETFLEIMKSASLAEIQRVLLEEWKTQDDWLEE